MKHITFFAFLTLLFIGSSAFSQILKLEYDTMMNKYLSKELSQLEFRNLTYAWKEVIDSTGYPEIPYDSVSKKVEYQFVTALDGMTRETIVNRVSEWAAVSFGSTDGLLTHQGTASRLILNGSIEVLFLDMFLVYKNAWVGDVEKEQLNSSICYFTLVFTIRDGKMKTQVKNLSYQYTDFISGRSIDRTLNSCFPISNNKQDEWKAIITLVDETSESLDTMMALLVGYIKDYENDYSW